jgi:hypothetical protein
MTMPSLTQVSVFVAGVLLAMLIAAPGDAQQPGTANDPQRGAPQGTAPAPPADSGSKAGDMAMMHMCRQMMMGDMMAMPMMGGHASADPKDNAEMLQMRGEMMKAMGDIMMKHARRMQGPSSK